MKLYMVFSISLGTGGQESTEPEPPQVAVQVHIGQTSPITVMASAGVRVGVTAPLPVLADSDVAAYAAGLERAQQEYSSEQGWGTPSIIICEIPAGMELNGRRLEWQAEDVSS